VLHGFDFTKQNYKTIVGLETKEEEWKRFRDRERIYVVHYDELERKYSKQTDNGGEEGGINRI